MSFRARILLLALLASSSLAQALDLGGVREEHVMIPMRDGVKLSTWLYFPEGQGKWPAIYEQRYAPIRADRTRLESAEFARHGYVVVTQSMRGAQDSEGVFTAYRALGIGEQKDGYDTIAWLVKQPWSDGKVGSYGASQGGYAQNFLAASQPPALVTQYMVDFGASLFHHGYRIGGAARPLRFRGMCETAGASDDGEVLLAEQLRHPTYDDWWAVEDSTRHFDAMDLPTFIVGSWFDRALLGVVETYQGRKKRHPGKQQLVIGPWVHGRYNKDTLKVGEIEFPESSQFSIPEHQMRWFDHFIKGAANGIESDPEVRYYVMGANEWRTADDWPPRSVETPYYLLDQGRLALEGAAQTSYTSWTSDPNNPAVIDGRQPPSGEDTRNYESQPDVRTFTTAVLEEPVEWTGMIKARLWLSSSARDTDVIVRLSDVYPDGRSLLLTDQVRRMRFRNGFTNEEFLQPGEVYQVDFDVAWMSQVFEPGHRIRITVASTGAPYWEINPQTGEAITADLPAEKDRVIAQNRLWHSGLRRSAILAPVHTP